MKSFRAAIAALLLVSSLAAGQSPSHPPVTLPGTQLRSLESKVTGREYELHVAIPASFAANPTRRYPVLYLLDGQWDFKLLQSIQGGLQYDQVVPELVIVGITYAGTNPNYDALRAADYTTVAVPDAPNSGGAPKFLEFLERELIPFVETNYRGDPAGRVLMGSSLGGLFTLYAMLTKPALFGGYVAGSPAVTFGNRAAFAHEREYAAQHRTLPVRLYLAVGAEEALRGPTAELMRTLRERRYRGLRMESRVVEGERHAGSKPEIFNRGLRFVFQGWR